MKKKIIKAIKKKIENIVKMVTPKVVTVVTNIVRMGPRIIFRSTVEMMRANLLTRILGCITLLIIDIVDLIRKRISIVQFAKNGILSGILVLSGTLGWELGVYWLSVELAGMIVVEVTVGLIGAAILSSLTNWIACKVADKFVKSDADKMMDIIDPLIIDLPKEEQEFIRENVTVASLKKMYASDNKEEYAREVVDKLKNHEKLKGILKPPHHKVASVN